jgi:hypothetical protein
MGKKRMIDRKIRCSQSFAALDYRQRDLWQGIIQVADDQGRMPGTAAFVRSEVWPYDDIPLDDVEEDLQRLEAPGEGEKRGFIVRYQVGGKVYLQVVKWWDYQTGQWAAPSDYPAPGDWQDRIRVTGLGRKIVTTNWDGKGGFMSPWNTQLDASLDAQPDMPASLDSDSDSVSDNVLDSDSEDDEESSSVPKILDMSCAVLRITGQNPTTAQVEELWEAGVTEKRVMAWYKDHEHGWPSIRPSNAERPDPWLSQVMEHLPNYRTDTERRREDAEKYGYESGAVSAGALDD